MTRRSVNRPESTAKVTSTHDNTTQPRLGTLELVDVGVTGKFAAAIGEFARKVIRPQMGAEAIKAPIGQTHFDFAVIVLGAGANRMFLVG